MSDFISFPAETFRIYHIYFISWPCFERNFNSEATLRNYPAHVLQLTIVSIKNIIVKELLEWCMQFVFLKCSVFFWSWK
jgi:hypothetical protein